MTYITCPHCGENAVVYLTLVSPAESLATINQLKQEKQQLQCQVDSLEDRRIVGESLPVFYNGDIISTADLLDQAS